MDAMTWVRLDDTMPDHPKVLDLSDAAFALHVRGLCYCGRHLTDGFVPSLVIRRLGKAAATKELSAAGLWKPIENGWKIHDYLEYQPSRDEVFESRRKGRARLEKWRKTQSEPRDVTALQERKSGDCNGVSNAVSNANPIPSHPSTTRTQERTAAEGRSIPQGETAKATTPWKRAVAIAHAVMDACPDRVDWTSEFKERALSQGFDYGATKDGRPLFARALDYVEGVRARRPQAHRQARPS